LQCFDVLSVVFKFAIAVSFKEFEVDNDDIDNNVDVEKLFKLVFNSYCVKSGLFIVVEFQSDGKLLSSFPKNLN
jgi:hypothetical protein